jgi:MFS family permease
VRLAALAMPQQHELARRQWSTDRDFALLVAAAGFGAAGWVDTAWSLWACYFVSAAGMGWIFPAFSALAANAVDPHEQGTTAGSIGAAQGMGMVAGPLIGTLLYAAGPAVPYLLVAAMLLALAVWPVAPARAATDRSSGQSPD